MKTKFLTLLLLLSAAVVSAETMRVAILEPVDRENKVSYATKLVLRSNLAKAVTNTAGYEAYDRSDMDAIMGEQNFQRTGMVSEDQIKRLGEMTGAKYILVAEAAVIDANNMFITAKVLDVETARTVMTDNLMMGMDAKKIQDGCATLAGNLFRTTATTSTTKAKTKENTPVIANTPMTNVIKMERLSKDLYSYGGTEMDAKAMEQFLRNNCAAAYAKYMSGKKLIGAGWGIFGAGLALTAGGAVMLGLCDSYYGRAIQLDSEAKFAGTKDEFESKRAEARNYRNKIDNLEGGGIALTALGPSIIVTTSVPLLGVGYYRKNHAHEIFNRQCATKEKLTLNLQASQNGLGLALNF